MNLATTIGIYGGGPGSGCRGENCGRPAGQGKTLWHGTVVDSAKKIFKEGLHQDKSKMWSLPNLKSSKGYVYMGTNEKVAEQMAMERAVTTPTGYYRMQKEIPAIVELRLPADLVKKLKADPGWNPDTMKNPDYPSWMLKGEVPKEYVAGVKVLDIKNSSFSNIVWRKMTPEELQAQATVPVYLVYYGDLDLLKKHLRGETV